MQNEYSELIAGYHRNCPKFQSWVYELTNPILEAKNTLADMPVRYFDLDRASGSCLDAIGVRVGFNRVVPIKLLDLYFAYDDVDGIGFDLGVWYRPGDDLDGFATLDDEIYRACLKVKVMLNHFTGENSKTREILNTVFDSFNIPRNQWTVHDNQNMSITINVNKTICPQILWELISRGIISLTPAGVTLNLIDHL